MPSIQITSGYQIPDYNKSPINAFGAAAAFLIGFAAGFAVAWVYYKLLLLSIAGGIGFGTANIFLTARKQKKKRKFNLRAQFRDMLEATGVSMRAGNPTAIALRSAREDLKLLYREDSDIIRELDIIIAKFNNAVPLSEAFLDFAERSGLEDIESFASVYKTIEGKSGKSGEIVRQTQSIITDKAAIEMEIETLMTAAKGEMKIMTMMPIIILLIMGYAGAGFLDSIYDRSGRIVATIALGIFMFSVYIGGKISSKEL